jgi:pyruvate carboxylase
VIGFMAGELGDLPGGWPEPFRTKVLEGRTVKPGLTELTDDQRAALDGSTDERRLMLNQLLFAQPTQQFLQVREQYGDVSVLATPDYLYGLKPGEEHVIEMERGVTLFMGLEAISEADEKGMRTVMATLNGQLRPVLIRDRSVAVDAASAEKADPGKPGHVAAPFSGVVTLQVDEGDEVEAGATIATIEAMKMEAAITTPIAGTIERRAIPSTQQVEAGDLLVVVAGT